MVVWLVVERVYLGGGEVEMMEIQGRSAGIQREMAGDCQFGPQAWHRSDHMTS